ncbi:hypothetical protein [Pseudoduganella sp.]|uniref:hypothetical protein n=1 Tax=Pseudoduganella sp. TaxID=1880898 RepID=UPI0035B3D5D1
MRAFLLACLLAIVVVPAMAQDPCPKDGDWSATCLETVGKVRQVKRQYLHRLALDKSGFAVIVIEAPREVVAVNRRGVVVVPGIAHTGDFDYPYAEQGVGRFSVGGKCGYFRAGSFRIVVPPLYDACLAVRDGEAQACQECVRRCTTPECQDSVLVGGKGFVFNTKGTLLRRFVPPA